MIKKAAVLVCVLLFMLTGIPCALSESIKDLWVSSDGSKGLDAIAWYKQENKNYSMRKEKTFNSVTCSRDRAYCGYGTVRCIM